MADISNSDLSSDSISTPPIALEQLNDGTLLEEAKRLQRYHLYKKRRCSTLKKKLQAARIASKYHDTQREIIEIQMKEQADKTEAIINNYKRQKDRLFERIRGLEYELLKRLRHDYAVRTNGVDPDPLQCIVCLTNRRDVVFLPCGHFACCQECYLALTSDLTHNLVTGCPVCKKKVERHIKVYIP